MIWILRSRRGSIEKTLIAVKIQNLWKLLIVYACRVVVRLSTTTKPFFFFLHFNYRHPTIRHELKGPQGAELCKRSLLVRVLARVDQLVLQNLEGFPDTKCNDRAQKGTHPVDPVVVWEGASSNTRTERTGWVQACSGVVNGNQVAQEKSNANDERSHERSLGLLDSQKQHRQAQERRSKR